MLYKIVVGRFNEDISWLPSASVIMNKGEPLNIPNEILLENVGRESESYLQYVIRDYNNLPDVVIFTQGRIYDHGYTLDNLIYACNQALLNGKSSPSEHYISAGFIPSQPNFNFICNPTTVPQIYKKEPVTFQQWFETTLGCLYPDPIYIYWNGIFAVRKDIILRKPVDFYKRLLSEINYNINPTEGHFFERSWYYIFD
jgi:hypothetical protein